MTSRKNKIIVIVLIEVIIFALIAFFGFYGTLERIKKSSAEFRKEYLVFDNWNSRSSYLAQIEKEYNRLNGGNFAKVREGFLDINKPPVDFIIDLESAVKKFGLSHEINVSTVGENEKQASSFFPFFKFRLTIGGDYVNIARFIEYLENMNYFVSVEKIRIGLVLGEGQGKKEETSSLGSNINANLEIKVYAIK